MVAGNAWCSLASRCITSVSVSPSSNAKNEQDVLESSGSEGQWLAQWGRVADHHWILWVHVPESGPQGEVGRTIGVRF